MVLIFQHLNVNGFTTLYPERSMPEWLIPTSGQKQIRLTKEVSLISFNLSPASAFYNLPAGSVKLPTAR